MCCAPGLVFDGTKGVGARFHVLCSRTRFDGTDSVGSRLHVLRSRTRFQRYRGRRVPFSCFALPDSFSMVPWAFRSVFMFSATGNVFGGTEGVGSRFHVSAPELVFGDFEGVKSYFYVFRSRKCFRRYRGRQVPFSCLAHPDSFLTV
jgi:hypothetical protein